jgi:hypothetical protein
MQKSYDKLRRIARAGDKAVDAADRYSSVNDKIEETVGFSPVGFVAGWIVRGALLVWGYLVMQAWPVMAEYGPLGWSVGALVFALLASLVLSAMAWIVAPGVRKLRLALRDERPAGASGSASSSATDDHPHPQSPQPVSSAHPAARARVSDPRPRESDKDKEAKDAIVRFCRTHLYELIEQERRCINLIIRELLGDDPQSTLVGRYAEKAIRSEFYVEPTIVAATKDSAYRESYARIELEALLVKAHDFTVERSIFISQALRERGFDKRKAIQIATELCKAREAVKTAWTELAGNPIYDTFQTTIGQSESSWGHLWMPPTSEASAKN